MLRNYGSWAETRSTIPTSPTTIQQTIRQKTFRRLCSDYRQRYRNLTPDAHAALAYDALRFLADAMRRAGTTEGPKLRDALAETKNFHGVTGMISMDRERNAVKSAVILKLLDTRYIYQETIQPESIASPASLSSTSRPLHSLS